MQDAKGILTGGDTAATEYFRRTTENQLTKRFLPIVKKATDRVGLAEQYNGLAGQAMQLGLVKRTRRRSKATSRRKRSTGSIS